MGQENQEISVGDIFIDKEYLALNDYEIVEVVKVSTKKCLV